MKSLAFLALAMAAVSLAVAYAQTEPVKPVQPISPSSGGASYPAYGTYHHASTRLEGGLRGMSDVVRSHGQANLDNSAAAVNMSVAVANARRTAIEDKRLWTDTYFQVRKANREYRAAERGPRATMEQLVRFAQAGKPSRLSHGELDPVTGAISWPILLRSKALALNRAEVEKAFSRRAASSVIGAEEYLKIRQNTNEMLAELKKKVHQLPTNQYVIAKRFLQSLAYEAGMPAT